MDWMTVARELGVLAGLVVFFAWTSWQREQRLAKRIDALEQFVEHELMKALNSSAEAASKQSTSFDGLVQVLAVRPCLLQDCKVIDQRVEECLERLGILPKNSSNQPRSSHGTSSKP